MLGKNAAAKRKGDGACRGGAHTRTTRPLTSGEHDVNMPREDQDFALRNSQRARFLVDAKCMVWGASGKHGRVSREDGGGCAGSGGAEAARGESHGKSSGPREKLFASEQRAELFCPEKAFSAEKSSCFCLGETRKRRKVELFAGKKSFCLRETGPIGRSCGARVGIKWVEGLGGGGRFRPPLSRMTEQALRTPQSL